jgi:hypothetical protein
VLRLPDRRSGAILAQDFCEGRSDWGRERKRELEKKERSKTATSARSASLRSENVEMKTRVYLNKEGQK